MAYAEKRGNLWRARWASPSGKLESQSGFKTRKAAEDYANDQESSVRKNTYVDVRAGQVTVAEIANAWYSGLDLEPTTMSNYRYMTEVYILPEFGERAVASLTEHQMPIWEVGHGRTQPALGQRRTVDVRDDPRERGSAVHPDQPGGAQEGHRTEKHAPDRKDAAAAEGVGIAAGRTPDR